VGLIGATIHPSSFKDVVILPNFSGGLSGVGARSIPEAFLQGHHVFDFGKLIPLIDAGDESALACFYEATSGYFLD